MVYNPCVQRLRRKQILISLEQERYLSNRARAEGRSESSLLRDLIDQVRNGGVTKGADPIDALVGAFAGRRLGSHDEILYGRRRKRGSARSSS
jgi:hypothetical protein